MSGGPARGSGSGWGSVWGSRWTARAGAVVVGAVVGVGGGMWLGIGLLGCSGSGYRFASSYDESIRTVAVPIWENTTFSHGLEFELTEALTKEIHRTTPWKVINTPGAADASLTGSIVSAELRKLSTQPDSGLVQELALEIVVAFEFKEASSGRVMVARRGFRASDAFVPSPGARERLEQGEAGAVDRLARSVVAELRQAW